MRGPFGGQAGLRVRQSLQEPGGSPLSGSDAEGVWALPLCNALENSSDAGDCPFLVDRQQKAPGPGGLRGLPNPGGTHREVLFVVDAHEVVASGSGPQRPRQQVSHEPLPLSWLQTPLRSGNSQARHWEPCLHATQRG